MANGGGKTRVNSLAMPVFHAHSLLDIANNSNVD
jgi:hypothetical protein